MHMLELGSGVLADGRRRGLDGTECPNDLMVLISHYEYQHRIFF